MMEANLKGEVNSILYHNPENNYVVARIKSKDEPGLVTIVGNIGQIAPGEKVSLTGEWVEHPKFGRQFKADSSVQELPASLNGIRRYLGSGLIKGVGQTTADRMVEKFGKQVLDILEQEPEKLLEVEGIGIKTLQRIKTSWNEQREIRSLLIFLKSYGVSPAFAGKIFRKYGSESLQKLRENPYDLAYEISGVGFKTADNMALKIGFDPLDQKRMEAAIIFTLFQQSDHGHLFFPKSGLFDIVAKMLDFENISVLETPLAGLQEKKRVQVLDLTEQSVQDAVFLSHFYRWEKEIASRMQELATHPYAISKDRLLKCLQSLEQDNLTDLAEEQREAVLQACLNKVYIITGGPGTGKTTITKFICLALNQLELNVKLAAPTGRAAKRLSEATGFSASTVHRLLGYSPEVAFSYNQEKKLKADVLILDEVSMLDCYLCLHLLRALPLTARLIMIGDANQLPSVGPGNILADFLDSQVIPHTELKRIYRQARESMVVINAHRINNGKFPLNSLKEPPEADFFWVEQPEPKSVQQIIVNLVCERIPKVYGFDPIREVQVLTPMHKGQVGTNELNKVLQAKLNPTKDKLISGNREYRTGDRVLQNKNNYEKDVFNGDLGWILQVNSNDGELTVDFDGQVVEYLQSELDELSLAYCISVHKSQGSEFPVLVMPVITQHFILLQRNLIYTALTRARKLAILIGSKKALNIGINNEGGKTRNTNLQYQVQSVFKQAVEKDSFVKEVI